jgi:programmed cell death protein 4
LKDHVGLKEKRARVLELAVNLALDRKATQREMASILISDLYGKFLSQKDISLGFDDMLNNLADLTIDTPDAPQVRSVCLNITILVLGCIGQGLLR